MADSCHLPAEIFLFLEDCNDVFWFYCPRQLLLTKSSQWQQQQQLNAQVTLEAAFSTFHRLNRLVLSVLPALTSSTLVDQQLDAYA